MKVGDFVKIKNTSARGFIKRFEDWEDDLKRVVVFTTVSCYDIKKNMHMILDLDEVSPAEEEKE